MKLPPDYEEMLDILLQLPWAEGDIFSMALGDEELREDFTYMNHPEPARADTITVSLEKKKYTTLEEARSRAAELFVLRKLRPYHAFQTMRCFCWYCVSVA